MINKGISPVKAEDPEVDLLIQRCVKKSKTLVATFNSNVLQFADCVVVDVQCDFSKKEIGNMRSGTADMGGAAGHYAHDRRKNSAKVSGPD